MKSDWITRVHRERTNSILPCSEERLSDFRAVIDTARDSTTDNTNNMENASSMAWITSLSTCRHLAAIGIAIESRK
jgi:hypothetical protein